ncbi:hypothetical protein RFI_23258 [Reticulomyxa filosa]|uniref:SAM domain-containing protein n=1 Tax=Reticulomyxa filosa TaxID=46433 RepID=X6MLZ5_RETFI|nr:hypothetical protein RFI_23258 [Reticulomyxa filosa]|eukprot:ETO14110.1 hypothetical protein RFI_23258 [Reticulomyxa filosa]
MKQIAEESLLKGEFEKSLQTWQTLLPLADAMPHLYAAYAVLLCFGFKKYEEAEMYLLKALELDPQNIAMRRHLGNVYMEWNRYDQAVKEFQQIIHIYNDYTIDQYEGIPLTNRDEINYNYAYALEQCEAYDQAVQHYHYAVEFREKEYIDFLAKRQVQLQDKHTDSKSSGSGDIPTYANMQAVFSRSNPQGLSIVTNGVPIHNHSSGNPATTTDLLTITTTTTTTTTTATATATTTAMTTTTTATGATTTASVEEQTDETVNSANTISLHVHPSNKPSSTPMSGLVMTETATVTSGVPSKVNTTTTDTTGTTSTTDTTTTSNGGNVDTLNSDSRNRTVSSTVETMSEIQKRYFICLFCYARCLRKNNQLAISEVQFFKLLQMWPTHYGVHVEYGLCLVEMKRFEEAQDHYITAIRINDQDPTAYRHYGTLCFIIKEYAIALSLWKHCFGLTSNIRGTTKDLSLLLARYGWCIYHLQKDIELARQYYETALGYDPTNSLALKCLGILLHKEYKESDKALQYLETVIKLEPNSAISIAWYADCLRCAKNISIVNRLEQVELYWNNALTIRPDLLKPRLFKKRLTPFKQSMQSIKHQGLFFLFLNKIKKNKKKSNQIMSNSFHSSTNVPIADFDTKSPELLVHRPEVMPQIDACVLKVCIPGCLCLFVSLCNLRTFCQCRYFDGKQKKFEEWLRDTVKLPEYLSQFRNCSYNDIRMINYIDEKILLQDVGILKKPHRMIFLKKAADLWNEMTAV